MCPQIIRKIFAITILTFALPIYAEEDTSKIINNYIQCLNAKTFLMDGTCRKIRNWIAEKTNYYQYDEIVETLVNVVGVQTYYYDGVKTTKKDKTQCENNKGLQGFYDPSRRTIVICSNNFETSGEARLVMQHEIVHAAQHCYGGTLSRNSMLKALYFRQPPISDDFETVLELYPKGEWVNELEARAGLMSGLVIDYATLLYLSCRENN